MLKGLRNGGSLGRLTSSEKLHRSVNGVGLTVLGVSGSLGDDSSVLGHERRKEVDEKEERRFGPHLVSVLGS